MDHLQLTTTVRDVPTTNLAALRASGKVPTVLYGRDSKNVHLWAESGILEKVWREAGESTIIDLNVDGKVIPVLIYDYQQDPVTGHLIHVDFYQVRMDQEIETTIPLVFVGESPAVEAEGGVLVKALNELPIACLPGDLVREINVDISSLVSFDSIIEVKDLVLPKGIVAKTDPEVAVAMVDRPRSAEELAALQGEVTSELPEGAEEAKAEENGEKKEDKKTN